MREGNFPEFEVGNPFIAEVIHNRALEQKRVVRIVGYPELLHTFWISRVVLTLYDSHDVVPDELLLGFARGTRLRLFATISQHRCPIRTSEDDLIGAVGHEHNGQEHQEEAVGTHRWQRLEEWFERGKVSPHVLDLPMPGSTSARHAGGPDGVERLGINEVARGGPIQPILNPNTGPTRCMYWNGRSIAEGEVSKATTRGRPAPPKSNFPSWNVGLLP